MPYVAWPVQDGGMDSGLAADDQYNLYSKPLFTDRGSNLYRPNKAQDDEAHGGEGADDKDVRSERFKPTKVCLPAIFNALIFRGGGGLGAYEGTPAVRCTPCRRSFITAKPPVLRSHIHWTPPV